MYIIRKAFGFSAAHYLPQLPEYHKCHNMHGHNYVVELEVISPTLNESGMVLDFAFLEAFKEYIDVTFDHRVVNDTVKLATSEALTKHFYDVAAGMFNNADNGVFVRSVRVSETPTTSAEYRN